MSREWFPQAAEGGRGNPTWFENRKAIFVITRELCSLERKYKLGASTVGFRYLGICDSDIAEWKPTAEDF